MKHLVLALVIYISPFLTHGSALIAQPIDISNPGFENGLADWEALVAPYALLEISEDSIEGNSSCRISDRMFFWTGIQKDLLGLLTKNNDYRFSMQLKSGSGTSGLLKIQIRQIDERGENYVEIGTTQVTSDTWTEFDGGFFLQTNGELERLDLVVSGYPNETFDFLIDDLRIEKRDWRTAADERIEEFRKSELAISIVDPFGSTITDAEVSVEQIRHRFAFGSTLSDVVVNNEQYSEFFKEHFEWATLEWRMQWPAVEQERGVEDYNLADLSLDFCRQNGIQPRGHAVAWSSPTFVPPWLTELPETEISAELDERIENVVSRYRGQLFSWDVCNEMLSHRFFLENLGPDIRSHIFRRSRDFDDKVNLFTNEYGIINRRFDERTGDYVELVEGLIDQGGEVNGIGIQGHFNSSNVSPYNIGSAIDRLSALDIPIWISEFDVVNPDDTERANLLETFYRYAFSRPELDGIVMWGFWAGAHWRGPDAALVDLDWQINAAGHKYLDLQEQWTTKLSDSLDSAGLFSFSGFHGSYLAKIDHPVSAEPTYHLFSLKPSANVQELELIVEDEFGCLSVYGTESGTRFEVDLSEVDPLIRMDDQLLPLPNIPDLSTIVFHGRGENDTLIIQGSNNIPNTYVFCSDKLSSNPGSIDIEYSGIEQIQLYSTRDDETVNIYGTDQMDLFVSSFEDSTMYSSGIQLTAQGFERTIARSDETQSDYAMLFDTPQVDKVKVIQSRIRSRDENDRVRIANGFAMNQMESTVGQDRLTVCTPNSKNEIEVSPDRIEIDYSQRRFALLGFPKAALMGAAGNNDVLNVFDSAEGDEYVFIRQDFMLFRGAGFRTTAQNYKNSNVTFSNSGTDILRIRDTFGDDQLSFSVSRVHMLGADFSNHTVNFPDQVIAVSNQGGNDIANVGNPLYELDFLGQWQFSK